MKNIPTLSFYRNSSGVVVGQLAIKGKSILATTHPATIAAALFAMNAKNCRLKLDGIESEIFLPFACVLDENANVNFSKEEKFVIDLGVFSGINFLNPPVFDNKAEIHFRTAIHHLPKNLVVNFPATPTTNNFMREIEQQNKYVYFPSC